MKYKILECEIDASRVLTVGKPLAENGGVNDGMIPIEFDHPTRPVPQLLPKGTRVQAGDYFAHGAFVPAVFFQAIAVEAIESGVDLAAVIGEPADAGVKDLAVIEPTS